MAQTSEAHGGPAPILSRDAAVASASSGAGENSGPTKHQPTSPLRRPILRLAPSVVNRIAAGEIILRPQQALKELLENSLDAGATAIQVTVREGGLALMQVQDNGRGIPLADLPLACERFATSKLVDAAELARGMVATFGFRGEALASLSHVAHVSITSRCRDQDDDPCAYRATYLDGRLVAERPGQAAAPRACAGNPGTTVTVRDLFYNERTRREAMGSAADELSRLSDVLVKYAMHYPHVTMSLRKQTGPDGAGAPVETVTSPGIQASAGNGDESAARLEVARHLYGNGIARELVAVSGDCAAHGLADVGFTGLVSHVNWHAKKYYFQLFINDRLVDHPGIKRALDKLYAPFLPKGAHPFIYLALSMPPQRVDINVHPTKKEVHFLDEERVLHAVVEFISHNVLADVRTRYYPVKPLEPLDSADSGGGVATAQPSTPLPTLAVALQQSKLPGADAVAEARAAAPARPPALTSKRSDSRLVRTDARATRLEQYFPQSSQSSQNGNGNGNGSGNDGNGGGFGALGSQNMPPGLPLENAAFVPLMGGMRRTFDLTSIATMSAAVRDGADVTMRARLRNAVLVGPVEGALALVQVETDLFLVDVREATREWGYQRALDLFGNFPAFHFVEPIDVARAVRAALDMQEASWTPDLPPKDLIAQRIADHLVTRADMLEDYFSLRVSVDGELHTVPRLLAELPCPSWSALCMFLLRLGSEVHWDAETPCFVTILTEIALLYAPQAVEPPPHTLAVTPVAQESFQEATGGVAEANERHETTPPLPLRVLKDALFPALRTMYPSPHLAKFWYHVTNLHSLYKVFERC